jgi:Bacterial protein of unknown function (DUF839)
LKRRKVNINFCHYLQEKSIMYLKLSTLALTATLALVGCGGGSSNAIVVPTSLGQGPTSSATPYLTPIASDVQFASILTTGDAVGSYLMGGIPDGLGAYDNGDGTMTVLMNHELGNTLGIARAHGGKGAYVSEWVIDKTTLKVKSGADLMKKVYAFDTLTSAWIEQLNVAFARFCSADLPAVTALFNSATGKGSQARIFLNGEENGATSRGLAIVASGADKGKAYVLPWAGPYTTLGAGWENLLAHPDAGDKTIVMANADGGDNGVYLYVGTKQTTGNEVEKAGLVGGQAYRVSVNAGAAETTAADAGLGLSSNAATFSLVPNTAAGAAGTKFLRPEDGAWDTVNKNRYYFVTTSQQDAAKDGNANSDIPAAQVGRTRLWSMNFTDITRPQLGGIIEMVLDGTETVTVAGRVHGTQMFDNITVNTDGTLILQEDVGGSKHNGKIWKYDPVAKKLTLLAQHDEVRFGDYVTSVVGTLTKDEESSGVIEVTSLLGRNDNRRYYLTVTQNHAAATGANAVELVEGGQLMLMSTAK